MSALDEVEDQAPMESYSSEHAVGILRFLNRDRKRSKALCDGVLESEGQQHAVHKCIVGAVSEVFGRMLDSDMSEKREKVVHVGRNISSETLDEALNFIYTGFVDVTNENVLDLLECSEYANIPGLKNICEKSMVQAASVENCLKLRAYAKLYNLSKVSDETECVIAENFSEVLQQDDLKEMDADDVTAIISMRKEKISESVLFTSITEWVKHDPFRREKLFVKLFSLVDITMLHKDFIDKSVIHESLVTGSADCMRYLEQKNPGRFVERCLETSKVLMVGGKGMEKQCLLYDTTTKSCQKLSNLRIERLGACASKIGQQVFVAGGKTNDGRRVEMFNVVDSKQGWKEMAPMPEPRYHAACAVAIGIMYISGGWSCNSHLSSCLKYDEKSNQWSEVNNMVEARIAHSMVYMRGSLWCVGGSYGSTRRLNSAERWDLDTEEWKSISPMKVARSGLAAVGFRGCLYVTGGLTDKGASAEMEKYESASDLWIRLHPLRFPRSGHAACILSQKIWVFGGSERRGALVNKVEVYDEEQDDWQVSFSMKSPNYCSAVATL